MLRSCYRYMQRSAYGSVAGLLPAHAVVPLQHCFLHVSFAGWGFAFALWMHRCEGLFFSLELFSVSVFDCVAAGFARVWMWHALFPFKCVATPPAHVPLAHAFMNHDALTEASLLSSGVDSLKFKDEWSQPHGEIRGFLHSCVQSWLDRSGRCGPRAAPMISRTL